MIAILEVIVKLKCFDGFISMQFLPFSASSANFSYYFVSGHPQFKNTKKRFADPYRDYSSFMKYLETT